MAARPGPNQKKIVLATVAFLLLLDTSLLSKAGITYYAQLLAYCIYSIYLLGEITNQERLWRETVTDDPTTERNCRRDGQTPTEINPKMMHNIQVLLSRLVTKARQLLGNATANLAECWMHIRSKFDGGKVIIHSPSGSWDHRCMGAGLQQNMGREWGPTVWSKMTKSSPNPVFVDAAQCCAKKAEKDRKRKATDEAKEQQRQSKCSRIDNTVAARKAYSRHDGIVPDDVADVSPEFLDESKTFYENHPSGS